MITPPGAVQISTRKRCGERAWGLLRKKGEIKRVIAGPPAICPRKEMNECLQNPIIQVERAGKDRAQVGSHMLNLHATFTKGTVEFRLFQFDAPADGKQNGLHAGQLKAYIQLCLALSEMAKTVKTASPKPQQTENPKYAMRTWLLRLGFIGEEFATARDLLTRKLPGDAAFRTSRAA